MTLGAVSSALQLVPPIFMAGSFVKGIYNRIQPRSQLAKLTVNITDAAKKGLGSRAHEREAVLTHLISKIESNGFIILQGSPGVGKSAIVEELAHRTANVSEPALQNTFIHRFDINRVIGTGLKGAFYNIWNGGTKDKINDLFSEIIRINQSGKKRIILWIDEIQDFLQHAPEVFDNHKEALARRDLMIIGATTESRIIDSWINRDKAQQNTSALQRRVIRINVEEPTAEATTQILKADSGRIKKEMGKRFKIKLHFDENSFRAAVILSSLCREDGKELAFPDKALTCLADTAAYICNEGKKKNLNEVTLDENSVSKYLSAVNPKLKGQIEKLLKDDKKEEDGNHTFKNRYFPELPAKETKLDPLIQTARQCNSSFKEQSNENILCIRGNTQTAIEAAVQQFAFQENKTIISCSLQSLVKFWQTQKVNPANKLKEVIEKNINQFGDQLVLLIRDGELWPQATSLPAKPIISRGNQFFSQPPQTASLVREAATFIGQVIPQFSNIENQLVEPEFSAPRESHPIIRYIQMLVENERVPCILTTTQPGKIDLPSVIECPDLTFADSVTYLQERLDLQATEETNKLILKVLYTLQSLSGSEKIELDSAMDVLQKAKQDITPERLKQEILTKLQGKKTIYHISDAWEKSALLDQTFFNYRKKPLINNLHQSLPPNLEHQLNVLIGGKRLLWIAEPSQAVRNLRREQIISYYLSRNVNVASLDLSDSKIIGLSPAIQKLLFQERFAEFRAKKSAILIMSEEDLSLPFVKEALSALAPQESPSIICLAKPEAAASQASESQGILIDGLNWIRNQGFLPEGPKSASTPSDLHPAALQMPTIHYVPEKPSKKIANEFILFTYARLSAELGSKKKQRDPLEESAKSAYGKIYTFLHQQYERSLDQIEQDMENDFASFSVRGEQNPLNQEDVIRHLFDIYKPRFDFSANDLRYIVAPNLTPLYYRALRSLKSSVNATWHFCTFPLRKATDSLGQLGSFFFSLWAGNSFRNFLSYVFSR